jgi:hypothetical protein
MSWKERRLITVLSAILLVLVIALVIVLAVRYRASMDDGSTVTEEPVAGLVSDETAYTSLTYFNGETTLSFERNELGQWYWTADTDLPLDDSVTDWKTLFPVSDAMIQKAKDSYDRTMAIVGAGMADVDAWLTQHVADTEAQLGVKP